MGTLSVSGPGRADAGISSLQLPYDRLKTPQTPFRGARVPQGGRESFGLPPGLSRDDRCAWAIAASAALFYRYSGQLIVPISLRIEAEDDSRSSAVLISVRGSMPSGAVVAAAKTELKMSELPADADAPLFLDIRFDDLQPGVPSPDEGRPDIRADLCLEFSFSGDSARASVFYNESLFTERTATRVLNYLKATFQSMRSDASTIVAAIGLFSREEQAWFETHCRAKPLQFPGKFVHEEIAGQAAKNPEKVAVRFNEEHLTFRELNARANQLARYLRRRGVPGEGRVLVCLEPSLEVAVVLLAILKAGATYVPVNPAHPEFRIRAIVEDTHPALIITQTPIRALVSQFGVEILDVGKLPRAVHEESIDDPAVSIQSRQIAYTYYTSGTTGQPKGVAASHANMIHFLNVARHRYRISPDDVIPAVASFTFSISMFELTAALSVGGTLLILERRHVLDMERMAATLQQVTLFHIGPSLLRNIVKYIKQNVTDYGVFSRVRHASSGGDMVPVELLRDLQRIFSSSELYVIYGCSEISLMGCTWELPREQAKRTLVGKPFRNVHLLLLDDDDNQVPIGAIGDVCFGGPGVVGGYLNDREKTAAQFFIREGVRFYRTGDRGRLNANGELELLGRRDFQIKLRGMRVELAEIEYHLRQAKGVRDGLVAAKPHSSGETVLVAYYVPDGGKALQRKELHAHMAARLPDYMVPVFYVELEALPLNYNMKVDRKALPDLVPEQVSVRNPPVTDTEHAIARIWCDLLHLDGVSLDDNFMLLGGDSLLAMEMILLVDRALNFKLDGMDVLRESLWILARLVDSGTGQVPSDADSADEPVERDILPVTSFHFGPDDSLYGVYSPARAASHSVPVLICPPIGYEYLRCHFFLRNLAERLAESGVPSLRFDFFASGDSMGTDTDASFERWQQDLRTGFEELKRRTGCDHARVFALRLTAALALKALPREEIDRWVLWDPAIDGAQYYRELRRMSKEKVHKLLVKRNLKRPARIPGAEELVGTRFSTESVESLKALSLREEDLEPGMDIRLVLSGDFATTNREGIAASRVLRDLPRLAADSKCRWYWSTRVTMAITNKDILDNVQGQLRAGP